MRLSRFRQRRWLIALAFVFAAQTATAAICIGTRSAHAAEISVAHCHSMPAGMSMQAQDDGDAAPHACGHCDAPEMGTPDAPAHAVAMPAMALLAIMTLPEPAETTAGATVADLHVRAPPDPLPLYLTTQRIRV